MDFFCTDLAFFSFYALATMGVMHNNFVFVFNIKSTMTYRKTKSKHKQANENVKTLALEELKIRYPAHVSDLFN